MSTPERDLCDLSLLDMFRMETETRTVGMTAGLLVLERGASTPALLEELMRNAHSLKGAANIVDRHAAVQVAHAMEDCFVAAQRGQLTLVQERIDRLLRGVDLLTRIAAVPEEEMGLWSAEHIDEVEGFLSALTAPVSPTRPTAPAPAELPTPPPAFIPPPAVRAAPPAPSIPPPALTPPPMKAPAPPPASAAPAHPARALRITAENLNRLLGLAGESVVASRWVGGFAAELRRLKRLQQAALLSLNRLGGTLAELDPDEQRQSQLAEAQARAGEYQAALGTRLEELESFDRRFATLSNRLYQEVLDCRMRPFSDGTAGLSRLVRDTARGLGKKARLELLGESTPVDREILERVEAPLGHLLRNAVDHGLETTEDRLRAGKTAEGLIRLEARHSAGMLLIEVSDDGGGIDLEAIRRAIVHKGLATPELSAKLSDAELREFLFLPGFSMKETVTEISGRGVGLDAVQMMAKEVGGTVRISSRPGQGTQFQLHLPLTLSVLRTLLVEIAGEPYAFPLARIGAVVKVPRAEIASIEGRQHFRLGDQQIGLITAHQLLELPETPPRSAELPVLVLGEKSNRYGVVVDRLLGEHELVVRPLDPRLGKIQDLAAAALTADQTPALIIDVDDLLRSIERLVTGGHLAHVWRGQAPAVARRRKRVLVVDDSLTVRELERKLISSRGYEVEVAIDGMDGWNAVRAGGYDLVVTDIDMPRLDGIELVTLIKRDAHLSSLPVMIVSYKDREEDRRRGLEAGADYYLTKGSFHDETLLRALSDLIGDAEA